MSKPLRVVIAMMKHETNTFSPVPTPLARFASGQTEPYRGEEVVAAYKGTNSALAAFLDLAAEAG
ncbi:MAG: M81 family metallopeptidase, partial [Haliea sp.]